MVQASINRRGLMLVLSSPSGAGKTTISRKLLEREPDLTMSVSVTTRPKRPGERDGVDYTFIDQAAFAQMVADGDLLEHATVFGNSYGTPGAAVAQALDQGRDVLFDIDWQGTQQLREAAREDVVGVFILPPSRPELERRLRARAEDSEEAIQKRMAKSADEMSHWPEYDYVIINNNVDASVGAVQEVLHAERLRRERQVGLRDFSVGLRFGAAAGLANQPSKELPTAAMDQSQLRKPMVVFTVNSSGQIDIWPTETAPRLHPAVSVDQLSSEVRKLQSELEDLRKCILGDNDLLTNRTKKQLAAEVSSVSQDLAAEYIDVNRLTGLRSSLSRVVEAAGASAASHFLIQLVEKVIPYISRVIGMFLKE